MNTPLSDFLEKYSAENKVRFHMPGHKGKNLTGTEEFDLTEVDGADVLYSASGIIKESMDNASALFGTVKTLYSTEGSSLSIRAMVYLIKLFAMSKGERPEILAFRNAHKTFITACAVMNTEITWLYSDENKGVTCCDISAEAVREYLDKRETRPTALYVTSPDYLGNMADIKALSELCHEKGIILAVDNAHGAYLNFLSVNQHPIHLGADICCDSAHKTLPVLTGGGYLHIGNNAPAIFSEKASYALSLFASTSPSYLIMRSLDKVNGLLAATYGEELASFTARVQKLKDSLIDKGYSFVGDEALKLTFDCKKYGYKGTEFAEYLLYNNIVCEFCDEDYTVIMLTPFNSDDELTCLERVLSDLPEREEITDKPPHITAPERVIALGECIYMPTEIVSTDMAVGRICSAVNVSCPPAVPIVIAGEKIGESERKLLAYYGVKEIEVVSE